METLSTSQFRTVFDDNVVVPLSGVIFIQTTSFHLQGPLGGGDNGGGEGRPVALF